MKVLITGGTGVIGNGVVAALLDRGHTVRLLSRHAEERADGDPRIEARNGDIAEAESMRGAAAECDAVLHVAGIVAETLPDATFQRINVDGTRNILTEAYASGVRRFVHLSSLGTDRGASDYHRSKREAEEIVQGVEGNWTIVRPGNVYGPGDEVISTLLKMVRALPVLPLIGRGKEPFQPLWHEDVAGALVQVLERDDLGGKILEIAGLDTTSMEDLVARIGRITGRAPATVPVPETAVRVAAGIAAAAGAEFPVDDNKLTMLAERIMIDTVEENALVSVLGIQPTPLDDGLRRLIEQLPETDPDDGVGSLEIKRYWADIRGAACSPGDLSEDFRAHCAEIMPIDFAGHERIEEGMNLIATLPGRGQIQMRVREATAEAVTFATVEGHPLAGTVTFTFEPLAGAIRFAVHVRARAADAADWLSLKAIGFALQDMNWTEVVRRMVSRSGGEGEVQVEQMAVGAEGLR